MTPACTRGGVLQLTLRCRIIFVPRPRGSPMVSRVMVKEPPAWDSQMYCSSSLCLETTVTCGM